MEENKEYCDPETGVCTPGPTALTTKDKLTHKDREIIYVGDPMCSWCWGISPALRQLKDSFEPQGVPFRIIVGGLRPGGGDVWNDQMKDFLAHHWQQVHERSGQPFLYDLLNIDSFDYDTEPSCRAVVVARSIKPEAEFDFFEHTQRKFYAASQDPKELTFYEDICSILEIDFGDFSTRFNSQEAVDTTHQEFILNRNWGVTGYPTVLLRNNQKLYMAAHGFTTYEELKKTVDHMLNESLVS